MGGIRIRNEALGRSAWAAQVTARNSHSAYIQFPDRVRRHGLHRVRQQLQPCSRQGLPDRTVGSTILFGQPAIGYVHGGLGYSVHVDERNAVATVQRPPIRQDPAIKLLAAKNDQPQVGQSLRRASTHVPKQITECGRRLIEDRHPLA
jgi:hypothetical protein